MVLQAVREDRMPGGRNSGAVYNLYKVGIHIFTIRALSGKDTSSKPRIDLLILRQFCSHTHIYVHIYGRIRT